MAALVCPCCGECWPRGKKYHTCPRCECETRLVELEDSIPGPEAEGLLNSYDGFRRWLARHPNREVEPLDLSRFDVIVELERIPVLEEKAA